VAIFSRLVSEAAKLMQNEAEYESWAWEAHHSAKKDAPSGTMLKLVEDMRRAGYTKHIDVSSTRAGKIPGTHEIGFDSAADTITLTHTARSREGFARGALKARNGWWANAVFMNSATLFSEVVHVHRLWHSAGNSLSEGRLARRSDDEEAGSAPDCGRHRFPGTLRTTGESPTLTREEHLRVVEITIEEAKGKVPVLAGAGGYNTHEVIELARAVEKLGADGILSVTPYYNKPTQEGLYQHYKAIAASIKIPIIVYSVQGRTGVNVEPATLARLAQIPNIIGVKEASGNIGQMAAVVHQVPSEFWFSPAMTLLQSH